MGADVAAIVPAAGDGTRIGAPVSKLFLPLGGQPLLAHTLRVLQAHPAIRWIVLVVREADRAAARVLLTRHRIAKALPPCLGGPSRAESVAKGFAAVPSQAAWVLVHDGARPCVSRRLIDDALRVARRQGAVACGLPASLTVKAVDERRQVRLTLDRSSLWMAQTPQVVRRDWFAQALALACLSPSGDGGQADHPLSQFPDDAAILEAAGFPVAMVPGDPLNLKVTTKEDMVLAEAILRTGFINPREPRCARPGAVAEARRRWRTRTPGTSRRSNEGHEPGRRHPGSPPGLGRSASARGVARRSRPARAGTPRSSRLAGLAARPSAAAGIDETGSRHRR